MNDIKTLPIVLASTSPRRQELLLAAGVKFVVNAVEIDESWQAKEIPTDYINRMVLTKAQQAALNSHLPDKCLLITADTIGVIDDLVLTKPKDRADAYRMWQMLSDTSHEIWTAVCISVIDAGQIVDQAVICECTKVTFVKITQAMMATYWASGEPQDKAGAYAIQGGAMAWVLSIDGSYTNVVGLPLAQTLALIDKMALQTVN
ncbi:Septum formation protein Maf [Moraxella catarrhalis]|uniref:Maf family protein n=1 Tax=Moraxella catarrhalis TaxID=480 RepID=UPI0007E842A0|nr:Maf family protein [Moraxella catarrhalis]OAV36953.1 Septum formation protein Maf [Moraxella catarrhalis]